MQIPKAGGLHQGRRPVLGKVSRSSCGLLLIWTWLLTSGKPTRTNPQRKKLSKLAISKRTGIPYTTVCERLSGHRGGGKRGKIAGGKCQSKVLDEGKQAGNILE